MGMHLLCIISCAAYDSSVLAALMQDQARNLQSRGICAEYMSSSQTATEQAAILKTLQASKLSLQLLLTTPESFGNDRHIRPSSPESKHASSLDILLHVSVQPKLNEPHCNAHSCIQLQSGASSILLDAMPSMPALTSWVLSGHRALHGYAGCAAIPNS